MTIHSSTHAWKIPWTEKPGGLQSMGLQRVGHDQSTSLSFSFFLFPILQADSLPAELSGKPMTNLDSVLKSRDITLLTKVHLVKAMVFPVVMDGCQSWAINKAEYQSAAFELWRWRRLLRVPWNARRSSQSILKEINPAYSIRRTDAKAPILWPPDAKSRLIGKDPDAGKD